jgi:hypothetical protein
MHKSQSRNISNIRKNSNMIPPKGKNSTTMDSKDSNVHRLSDKELKRKIRRINNKIVEDMNKCLN